MLVRNVSTGTVTFGESEFVILSGVTANIPENRYEALKSEFDALVAVGQIEVFFGEVSYGYEFIPIRDGIDGSSAPDALGVLTDSNKVQIRKTAAYSGGQDLFFYWKVPNDLANGNIYARLIFFSSESSIPAVYTGAITKFANNGGTGAITQFADDGSGGTIVTSVGHGILGDQTITITLTTNYNGVYTTYVSDPDTFVISTPFVGDDATGTWTYANGNTIVTSVGHEVSFMYWSPQPVNISGTTNYEGAPNAWTRSTDTFIIDVPFVGDDATGIWDYTGGSDVVFMISSTVINDGTVLGAVPLEGTYVNAFSLGLGSIVAAQYQQIFTPWYQMNFNPSTLAALSGESVLEMLLGSGGSGAPNFYKKKVGVAGIELRYERMISR